MSPVWRLHYANQAGLAFKLMNTLIDWQLVLHFGRATLVGVISLVVYFYYFMSLLASVVLNKLLLRLYDYCNLVYIVRVGNKDNNDYNYNSIIQIVLQMQGDGSGFSVLFFFLNLLFYLANPGSGARWDLACCSSGQWPLWELANWHWRSPLWIFQTLLH